MKYAPVSAAFVVGLAAGIVVARVFGSSSPVQVEASPSPDTHLDASSDASEAGAAGDASRDAAGDRGDAGPPDLSKRLGALAFPEPGWIPSTPRRLATDDLWVVSGVRLEQPSPTEKDAHGDIEHWPLTRIAVVGSSNGTLGRVAMQELATAPIACDSTNVVRRYYGLELEDPADLAAIFPGEKIVPVRVTCDRRWTSGTDRGFAYLIVFVVDGEALRAIWSGRVTESYTDVLAHAEKETSYVLAAEPPETLGKRRLCLREGTQYGRYAQCYRWDGEQYVEAR
jgi:hypothetical protein